LATHRIIARQPILDRYEGVFAYEFRFSPGEEKIWSQTGGDLSGENQKAGAPDFEVIDELAEGARAFIKCSRQALISGSVKGWPSDRVILEIPPNEKPDEEIVAACRALKDAGFLFALEDYQEAAQEPLADVADIIRLDVSATTERAQWLLIRKYRPRGVMFVADKVEKRAQFQAAVRQGFTYFQGQFFTRPQPYSPAEVSPTKLVYLLVLGAVTRPDIDINEVTRTIKHDLALSYNLLRFLNSARFAFHSQIKSIRHALLLLGQNEIRKWVGLISLAALGEGGPPLLVTMALIRGALCESLAPLVGEPKRQSDYFFLGLLSSIDVLMRRPMRAVLAELPIAPDVAAALMGEENPLRNVLRAVISYEQGDWEECSEMAKRLALKEETLCELYMQALRWSHELTHEDTGKSVEALSS
jgi:EAL and modified HD-GYP domain-containing signal transduction protein